jgi:hypothetical protein
MTPEELKEEIKKENEKIAQLEEYKRELLSMIANTQR